MRTQNFFQEMVMKAPRRPARSLLSTSFIEQLESRQLLSVGLSGGILTVNGSNRADNIAIKASGTQIVVHLNGTTKTFVRSQVKQLLVNGNSGNDKITVAGNFADATLNGGNGNDKIKGSGGGDLIQGGAGSDIVNGRGGDDQIYGDAGNDILAGGAGNDTIGGDDEDTLVAEGATAPADIAGNAK